MAFRYKDQAQLYIQRKRSDQKSAADKKILPLQEKYLFIRRGDAKFHEQAGTHHALALKASIHLTICSQNKPFITREIFLKQYQS